MADGFFDRDRFKVHGVSDTPQARAQVANYKYQRALEAVVSAARGLMAARCHDEDDMARGELKDAIAALDREIGVRLSR